MSSPKIEEKKQTRTLSPKNKRPKLTINLPKTRTIASQWKKEEEIAERREQMVQRRTMFHCKAFITIVGLAFCIYQLIMLNDCEDQRLYSGILTGMIAYWLPSPHQNIVNDINE